MIGTTKRARRVALAALALGAVALAGCEDVLDTIPDDRLAGLAVLDDGVEVARYIPGSGSTGRIQVGVGEQHTYRVVLLDALGRHVPIAGSYSLRDPIVLVTPIASAVRVGSNQVRVTGRMAGNTTLILDVQQGFDVVVPEADIRIEVGGG